MDEDNLRANEKAVSTKIEEIVQSIVSDSVVSNVRIKLVESTDGFRYVQAIVRVIPDSLGSTAALFESQLGVRNRDDDAARGIIDLECSIPDPAWNVSELPEDYRRVFNILVTSDPILSTLDETKPITTSGKSSNDISLLLSGGGFRATLFHLGIIRYLRENQRLDDVEEVFSISGGSIAAAHLAKRWDDYSGTDSQFHSAADELVNFAKRGIREEIVRKYLLVWLIPLAVATGLLSFWWFFFDNSLWFWIFTLSVASFLVTTLWLLEKVLRPIRSLEVAYRKLFGTATTAEIPNGSPNFFFLATNLTTGNICCFGNRAFYPSIEESKKIEEQSRVDSGSVRLTQCVAASSAFPPLFSPFPLNLDKLSVDQKVSRTHYLTDGGVFDNLGLRACRLLSEKDGLVFVSDAERKFDWVTESDFRWLPARASRATDVLMHRVNNLEHDLVETHRGILQSATGTARIIRFARLQNDFENAEGSENRLSPDLKRRIRRIRTDLDAFTDVEIQSLFTAGFLAAKVAFNESPTMGNGVTFSESGLPAGTSGNRWLPVKNLPLITAEQTENLLDSATSPKHRLVDWKSVSFYLMLLTFMALLFTNPITMGIAKYCFQVTPSTLGTQDRYSISSADIPEQFERFVDLALDDTSDAPSQEKYDFLILQSPQIGSHALLHFSPKTFRVALRIPDGYKTFRQLAFLYFEDSKTFRKLKPVEGLEDCFIAEDPTDSCRLVYLIGISSAEFNEETLAKYNFQFVTGECHELIQ